MKKSLFLILLVSLILAGCSSQKLSQDQLFEKKQECSNQKERIEKNLSSNEILLNIFYSKKANSCLYTTEYNDIITLKDFFNNETIIRFDDLPRCENVFWSDIDLLEGCTNTYNKSEEIINDFKK